VAPDSDGDGEVRAGSSPATVGGLPSTGAFLMLFVWAFHLCLLGVGLFLALAREVVVKIAGVLLTAAVFLLALGLWLNDHALSRLTGESLGEALLLNFLLVAVGAAVCGIAFFVGLRRRDVQEGELLSSVDHPLPEEAEPREGDWQREPPPPAP